MYFSTIRNIYIDIYEKYKIENSELLNIGNIISIILYCDYDTLRLHFKNTFYKQKLNIEYDICGVNY